MNNSRSYVDKENDNEEQEDDTFGFHFSNREMISQWEGRKFVFFKLNYSVFFTNSYCSSKDLLKIVVFIFFFRFVFYLPMAKEVLIYADLKRAQNILEGTEDGTPEEGSLSYIFISSPQRKDCSNLVVL